MLREKRVNQLVVKRQTALVDSAYPVWQDARPGDGETVSLNFVFSHKCDIVSVPKDVVAGDFAARTVMYRVGSGGPIRSHPRRSE